MNRKKAVIFFVVICFACSAKTQVRMDADKNSWTLETNHMMYAIKVIKNKVLTGYYGASLKENGVLSNYFSGYDEVPVRGGNASKSPVLEVVFSDGTRDLDLIYDSFSLSQKNGYEVLRIDQKDTYYPIKISSFFRILPEYDLIEKWLEVTNTGKDIIKLENALSGSLWLPQGAYEMTNFAGGTHWYEFQPKTDILSRGVKTIQSRDFKTYGSSYFTIRPKGEINDQFGNVWYGQLHYSGNWRTEFESFVDNRVQITSGINFWDTEWNLRASETFTTPVFSFGFTQQGPDKASQNYAAYIRNNILPKKRNHTPRPVIYNSWYATEFNINEQQQLALAKVAKDVGVEMFVIDDGWFKGRVNDRGGLGDWSVDKNKFPNGLNPMINQINKMGMDFGIWIEPEMVNPNSDLYRAHPDWVLHFNNRPRTLGRNQLMLNLARQDVYDYLYKSFYDLLKNHNIKYIKWDMNKALTEPGWPEADPLVRGEVRIRYIDNLYKLWDSLTSAFPDVWFETCSSGGGRVDLGIFHWADAAWASDNIDPVDRLFIQYGYLSSFPASTMISWTGYYDNHGIYPTLDFRFDVAMSGVLGIGNDMTKWTVAEKETAKRKVSEYKKIRNTVHNGTLYKLASPFETNKSILQYNSADSNEIVVFCYKLDDQLRGSSAFPNQDKLFRLRGLQEDAIYTIEDSDQPYYGQDLMNVGIPFPLSKSYTSKIIVIKKR